MPDNNDTQEHINKIQSKIADIQRNKLAWQTEISNHDEILREVRIKISEFVPSEAPLKLTIDEKKLKNILRTLHQKTEEADAQLVDLNISLANLEKLDPRLQSESIGTTSSASKTGYINPRNRRSIACAAMLVLIAFCLVLIMAAIVAKVIVVLLGESAEVFANIVSLSLPILFGITAIIFSVYIEATKQLLAKLLNGTPSRQFVGSVFVTTILVLVVTLLFFKNMLVTSEIKPTATTATVQSTAIVEPSKTYMPNIISTVTEMDEATQEPTFTMTQTTSPSHTPNTTTLPSQAGDGINISIFRNEWEFLILIPENPDQLSIQDMMLDFGDGRLYSLNQFATFNNYFDNPTAMRFCLRLHDTRYNQPIQTECQIQEGQNLSREDAPSSNFWWDRQNVQIKSFTVLNSNGDRVTSCTTSDNGCSFLYE